MMNQERMERIELPEELEQVILEAVELGTKKKKQVIWKRAGLGCMGAAAAFAVLVFAGFASPVAARAFEGMPAVGKVFTYLYDLAGYEGRYAQVAEDARPAIPADQKESGSEDFSQEEIPGGIASGRQETAGQQDAAGQQSITDQQDAESRQNEVIASDAGITITVKEYFCDRKNLYLSMTVESEEPFFESGVEENMEGRFHLFTDEETLSYEGMDPYPAGNSALLVEGVYLDDHTFVGIARSEWRNVKEENLVIPDELTYTALIKHVKIYSPSGTPDFRGEWKFSMDILCEEDGIEILPVEAAGEDGSSICEVRLQPYEVQVVTKTGSGETILTEEEKMPIVFDEEGNLLNYAGSIMSYREGNYEIYEYARPEELKGLEIFIVDEGSWMDRWKGRLYDGTMTGPEMVEFLKENCILHASVDCVR